MQRRFFGTDGIRGRVGSDVMKPEMILKLGYAAGKVLTKISALKSGQHPAILIAKDTRVSGYLLETALESGLLSAGIDVLLAGPLPTPAVAYLTRALRLQGGCVISASHNPYYDNGIKFFSGEGFKLADSLEFEIEQQMDQPMLCVESAKLGKALRMDDAAGRYIEFCKSTVQTNDNLRGFKIAVDCANGAAYSVAPKVFHELGAEVLPFADQPNGMNINDQCGATSPQALAKFVCEKGADIGIALDGDGDRLIMVDGYGDIYSGDQLLYIIAKDRYEQQSLSGVVGTVMTNRSFELEMQRWNIPFERSKVGDRYVLETLRKNNWNLGGESSGHILCLDKHCSGDGIISALQVLMALKRKNETLKQACQDLVMMPQLLVNVKLPLGADWQKNAQIQQLCADIENALGTCNGRLLVRPSGTEPLLRFMLEGLDEKLVKKQSDILLNAFQEIDLTA